MKTIFLTSNTKHYHKINNKKVANEIDNINGIVEQIKNLLEKQVNNNFNSHFKDSSLLVGRIEKDDLIKERKN